MTKLCIHRKYSFLTYDDKVISFENLALKFSEDSRSGLLTHTHSHTLTHTHIPVLEMFAAALSRAGGVELLASSIKVRVMAKVVEEVGSTFEEEEEEEEEVAWVVVR